jgi:uncharacterized membrane protein
MSASSRFRARIAEEKPSTQLFHLGANLISLAAGASFLLVLWQVISRTPLPGKPGWPEALLVVTTLLATLASLARQLPVQNVLLAAAIIGGVGGVAHGVGAVTAIPFGPYGYTDAAGPKFFNTLAWAMPALWVIIVLNSRGVARLILRPWRKLRNYGFWLIGITAGLGVLFDLALEPFASAQTTRFWLWLPTKFPYTWQTMPLTNSLGWLVVSLLILAFATPPLINKQTRSRKVPPDFHPLAVWLAGLALFATSAVVHQVWAAAGFCAVIAVVTTVFALRGARW